MRPVNLIPADERRGDRAPMRTGSISYVVVGALALALLAVIAVAFTSKQISDRESEVASLQQEEQAVTAKAETLRAFADFRAVQESRTASVASLAQSRFDWERVIRELSLVIPDDVWLINLTGTASPGVSLEDGADITVRDTVEGPALEVVGCAPSQDAVARFITDLEDIDGVTRVGIQSSERPTDATQEQQQQQPGAEDEQEGEDCRTRDFITKFELVVAFDAVPTPPTATAAPSVPAPVAPAAQDGAQLAGTEAQTSAAQQTAKAQDAQSAYVPGG